VLSYYVFNETIEEAEKRKKELEETMIRRARFERKTSEQVGALVQTLKRMIADESDSDVNDPKECKALETIFNHAIAPGWGYFGEEGVVQQAI
jgi:uncharacterized protein YutE (UPF0331/DUF86 family)